MCTYNNHKQPLSQWTHTLTSHSQKNLVTPPPPPPHTQNYENTWLCFSLLLERSKRWCISEIRRQWVPHSWCEETERALTEGFQVTFWNFEKIFMRGPKGARWFIGTKTGRKVLWERPSKWQYARVPSLYWDWNCTGSQCSSLSKGVIWSRLDLFMTNLAAWFRILCRRNTCSEEIPARWHEPMAVDRTC